MKSVSDKNISLIIILYSSLFILTIEALLIKISPQLFSIFNLLPFIFIGLCLNYRDLLITIVLSFSIVFISSLLFDNLFQKPILVFFTIISSVTIVFFGIKKVLTKLNINNSNTISYINLLLVLLLAIFQFLFFTDSGKVDLKSYLLEIISEIVKVYNLNDKISLDELVEFLVLILPSINSLVFLITFSLNYTLANYLVQKINLPFKNKISFNNIQTPLWFSSCYLFFIISYMFLETNSSLSIFCINSFICMSFSYLFEGYGVFNNYLKKIEISNFLKFLLIFLLFLFLGYVLLLIILFLGYFRNLKKLRKI